MINSPEMIGKRFGFILLLFTFIALCGMEFSGAAHATEPLFFKENKSPTLNLRLIHFLSVSAPDAYKNGYLIAEISLNADTIPEYILKNADCSDKIASCYYIILAEKNGELKILSEIKGRKLEVSTTKNNGIRDILSFNNNKNDYDYSRYIWSPSDARYMLESEEQGNE